MNNSKKPTFQNHWLSMLDSVEENLKYYRRSRQEKTAVAAGEAELKVQNNAWLACADSVENVLQTLSLNSEHLRERAQALKEQGLVSNRAWQMIVRFQTLSQRLAEQSASAKTREVHAEYCQLADQIMPTLARINKRVAARRRTLGAAMEPFTPGVALSDDPIDVALRAAMKRRQ